MWVVRLKDTFSFRRTACELYASQINFLITLFEIYSSILFSKTYFRIGVSFDNNRLQRSSPKMSSDNTYTLIRSLFILKTEKHIRETLRTLLKNNSGRPALMLIIPHYPNTPIPQYADTYRNVWENAIKLFHFWNQIRVTACLFNCSNT